MAKLTVAKLVSEYGANAIVYADRGNGSAYGERGQLISYEESAARTYGKVHMHRLAEPVICNDGIECRYSSDWLDTKLDGVYGGANEYQFRILF